MIRVGANLVIKQVVIRTVSENIWELLQTVENLDGLTIFKHIKNHFETLDEELIADVSGHFHNVINPFYDMSPMKRYHELKYLSYISLDDFSKARLLYYATNEPTQLGDLLNRVDKDKFIFSDVEKALQVDDYLKRKKLSARKRKAPLCSYCGRPGHTEDICYNIKALNSKPQSKVANSVAESYEPYSFTEEINSPKCF